MVNSLGWLVGEVTTQNFEPMASKDPKAGEIRSKSPFHIECEILDLRLEITYQYAINHIHPYEARNNIVRA